ncbi:MAG: tyrosine-type recombinase/integrase, partial [Polyangiaceae bacterium]|nr:tyrosine-type recombinase/integrase [Polyangiaceae bacterium]
HSLRHTYATWLALLGKGAMVVQQRGGWSDLGMVMRYVEDAEVVGLGDVGVAFPVLPYGFVLAVRESVLGIVG